MKGKKITKTAIRRSIPLYLLLLPSFVLLFCFSYLPLGGLVMAFERYSPSLGIFHSPFDGFDNSLQFFRSYQFWPTIRNTLVLSFYSLLVAFPLPILLALLCNQLSNGLFKQTFQVITYLPHFISTMVMCGLILIFLSPSSGLFANLFHLFGRDFPNVMASASAFKHVYVWTDVWQNVGWDSIIYLAALSSIDPTYYEAATMDGATVLQKIRFIDLPLILPTAMTLMILRVGGLLSIGFEKAFLLQNVQNIMASEIISTYVYKIGLQSMQYSLSTAIGLFNTIVNVAILLFINKIGKKMTGTGLF